VIIFSRKKKGKLILKVVLKISANKGFSLNEKRCMKGLQNGDTKQINIIGLIGLQALLTSYLWLFIIFLQRKFDSGVACKMAVCRGKL
jgi:hypothetical protein